MGLLSKIKRENITSGKASDLMKYYDKLMAHIWLNPYFNSRNTSIQVLQSLSLLLFYMLNVGDIPSIYELRGKVVSMSQQLRLHRCPSAVLGGDGSTVSKIQQGERRILFWSIYYLDVFSALQLGVPRLVKDFEIECALPVTSDDDKQVNLAGQMIALEGKVSQFSLSVIRFAKVMGNILDSTFKRGMTTQLTKQAALVHENALDNWRHGLQDELFFQLDVNGTINMDEFNQQKKYSQSISSESSIFTQKSLILMTLYFIAKCMVHLPVVATKPLVYEVAKSSNSEEAEKVSVDRSLSSYVLLQQATNTLLNVLTALNNQYLPLPINLARTKIRFGLFSARGSLEYTKGGALFQDNKALLLDLVKELEADRKLGLPSTMSWHSLKLFDLSINLILQPVNSNPEKTEKMIQKKINYYNKLMGHPSVNVKRKRDGKSTTNTSKKVKVEEDQTTDNMQNVGTGETTDTAHSEDLVKDVPREFDVLPENYTTIQEAFQLDPVLNTNPFSNTDLKALFNTGMMEASSGNEKSANYAENFVGDSNHALTLKGNGTSLLNLNGLTNENNEGVQTDGLKANPSMSNLLNLSNSDSLFRVPSNGDFLKDYYINNMSNTGLSNANSAGMKNAPSLSQLSSLFMSGGSGNNTSYNNVRGNAKQETGNNFNTQRNQPTLDGVSFAADASLGLAPLLAWSPDSKSHLNSGSNNGNGRSDTSTTGIVLDTGEQTATSPYIAQLQQQQQQQQQQKLHNNEQGYNSHVSASIPKRKLSITADLQKNHPTRVSNLNQMNSPATAHHPLMLIHGGISTYDNATPPVMPSSSAVDGVSNTNSNSNSTPSASGSNRRGPRRRWNNNAGTSNTYSNEDQSVSDLLRWQNGP